MADFFKYWYTIEETAEILNKHFNYLKRLNFKVFDTQDIINFYREERIRLALHIQELDNEKPIINLFNQQIVVDSFLYDFFDDEEIKGDIQITSGDSVISLLDDYLYAKGYFSIPVSCTFFDGEKFLISALKIYSEDQIDVTTGDSVDYEFSLNHSFSITFTAPIEINKKDVIILRGDILDLISMIENENKNAHIQLEHNRSPKITENNSELVQQLTAKDEEIARLTAEIAELKKEQAQPTQQSNESREYSGEIPPQTDKDKLAHFIKLIIQKSEFVKNGKMPTYSELHTMLNHAYTKEKIPSKNTLNKYLNP